MGEINIPGFDPNKYGKPPPTCKSTNAAASATAPDSADHSEAQGDWVRATSVASRSVTPTQVVENSPHKPTPSHISVGAPLTRSSSPASNASPSQSVQIERLQKSRLTPASVRGQKIHRTITPVSSQGHMYPALTLNPAVQNGVKPALKQGKAQPAMSKVNHRDESPEETLLRLQEAEVNMIGYRNRGKAKEATTSLAHLALARTPATTDTPSRSYSAHLAHETSFENTKSQDASPTSQNARSVSLDVEHIADSTSALPLPKWGSSTPTTDEAIGNQIHPAFVAPPWPETIKVPTLPPEARSRNPNWCSAAETKAAEGVADMDSNAWGSEVPSGAETDSGDSLRPMHDGKFFERKKGPIIPEAPLSGWDGKFQPPPVDWNDRPRFNNNTPAFIDGFNSWARAAGDLVIPKGIDSQFESLPSELLLDLSLQADGIGLVPRNFTLSSATAEYYGYTNQAEVTRYCRPITAMDWTDWGKLDLSDEKNVSVKDETTQQLLDNWNAHQRRKVPPTISNRVTKAPNDTLSDLAHTSRRKETKANIYVRPGLRMDVSQLTSLYNWHVVNTPRAAECLPITARDMRSRMALCHDGNLPFIVAISRAMSSGRRQQSNGTFEETVAGFACASDFTSPDFSERISAELEVYVHPSHMQKGVGRALMDKLLEATDRGHLGQKLASFRCDPAIVHKYEAGGARDLHALMFVVRQWKVPKVDEKNDTGIVKEGGKVKAREDDWDIWIQPWLESWDFEVQGVLKGIGTKNGRFLNTIFLQRETTWQPIEGQIPEYRPLVGAGVSETEDGEEQGGHEGW